MPLAPAACHPVTNSVLWMQNPAGNSTATATKDQYGHRKSPRWPPNCCRSVVPAERATVPATRNIAGVTNE